MRERERERERESAREREREKDRVFERRENSNKVKMSNTLLSSLGKKHDRGRGQDETMAIATWRRSKLLHDQ